MSFSVLINGSPYGNFTCSRSLRQGDPLTPYLFILCADVLSSLIHQAKVDRIITPLRLSIGGPAISHLLFADDSLFFLKADLNNAEALLKIFKVYERGSGQLINLDKSTIKFGSKVFDHTRSSIQAMLNIPNIGGGGKYLGLSKQFNSRKSETFKYIKDNVHTKIHGWQTRFLSTAGKEILLKAVAFAMPVFLMNVFELPMQVRFELDSMISGYWWGSTENQRKLAWVS